MDRNPSLLDTLRELQVLDRVPRSGYSLRGVVEPESVSEHAFHVVFLVWTLADRVPTLDRLRAVELALVHDLAEARTGDLPQPAAAYLPAGAKAGAEKAAMRDLLAPLGERALELFDEYQAKSTREARFVSACDKLQLLIKASVYESWGAAGLDEFWQRPGDGAVAEFPALRELLDELVERRREQ